MSDDPHPAEICSTCQHDIGDHFGDPDFTGADRFCEITGCRCRAFEASDNVARNAMVILLDSERLGLMKLDRNELGEVVAVSITAAGRQYLAQVDRPKT